MNTKYNYNGRNHHIADVLQENINHDSNQVNLLSAEAYIIHNSKRFFNQLPVFNRVLNPGQVSFGSVIKIIFLLFVSQVLASAVAQPSNSIILNNFTIDNINKTFEKEINESMHVNSTSNLRDDCVEDIKAQQFQDAMKKLLKMDNSEINPIITKVYNKQEENFDLLLNFANNITHVPQNFLTYSALYFEMSTNGHTNNPFHFISLAKGLKTEVIDQPWYFRSVNSEYKTQSEKLINDIMNKIKNLSKNLIKQAMLPTNAYSSDPLVKEIATLNYDLSKQWATDLVNDAFNTTDTQALISLSDDHFDSFCITIFFFTAIYDQMPRDDPAMFELTLRLKKLMNKKGYHELHFTCKLEYEKLQNRIPEAVRNLVYADTVCIKNAFYNEYLFASNYSHDSVENKRLIFTRKTLNTTDQNLNQYKWIFENENSNIFRIKNVHYPGYMYASFYSVNSPQRRHVFNSMPGNDVAGNWRIIPKGDNFHFLNMDKNEYLFANSDIFWDSTKESRYIYSKREAPYDGTWKIEKNC